MTMHRFSQGGADRVGILLANGFAAAGIPTRIAVLRGGGEGETALLDLLDPRVDLCSAGPPMTSRHLELARGLPFIEQQISSADPSVVLASSNNMGLVTGLSAMRRRQPGPRYAMKVTNPVLRPRDRGAIRTFYRRRLYGFIFGKYDLIMTLSEPERHSLSCLYPQYESNFVTTPNAYITREMLSVVPKTFDMGHKIILSMARMMPQKRLDRLLLSFSKVLDKNSRLIILGDGPDRPRLERMARSLGIAGRVEMPGFVEDVLPWLHRADVFALSSDYEGLPAALLEALACNVPVITTDCFDGVRSLLACAERCSVVPRGNADAFARAIDATLAQPGAPIGLRKIAQGYGVDASIAAHLSALEPLFRPGEMKPVVGRTRP